MALSTSWSLPSSSSSEIEWISKWTTSLRHILCSSRWYSSFNKSGQLRKYRLSASRVELVKMIWRIRWLILVVHHILKKKHRMSFDTNAVQKQVPTKRCPGASTSNGKGMQLSPFCRVDSLKTQMHCKQRNRCTGKLRRAKSQHFTREVNYNQDSNLSQCRSRNKKKNSINFEDLNSEDIPHGHECLFCQKSLHPKGQIYMYRDSIFCSETCRASQIRTDSTNRTECMESLLYGTISVGLL
mmetsp:Transcript_7664/g.10517  ORF Transcript_7664/g.10517 Transcript_7664/m.10517 type:complete len:241 (+) Transcript_7664:126-848(+)